MIEMQHSQTRSLGQPFGGQPIGLLALLLMVMVFFAPFSLLADLSHKVLNNEDLRRELAHYKGLQAFSAGFTQIKKLKDLNLTLKSRGTISISRNPASVKFALYEPSQFVFEWKEKPSETHKSKGPSKEVSHLASQGVSFQAMLSWLKLDADLIYLHYSVEREGDWIRFHPRKKGGPSSKISGKISGESSGESSGMPIREMRAKFNSKKRHLEILQIFEFSGDEIHFQFSPPRTGS